MAALALATFAADKPVAPPALSAGVPANSLIIEVLIDGPSELRVQKGAIYWINGRNAKPGRHMGKDLPAYVNGEPWALVWKNPAAERGADRCEPKSIPGLDPDKLDFSLLSVGINREQETMEKRDEIDVRKVKDELSINIPDSQPGSRWYKFVLVKQP